MWQSLAIISTSVVIGTIFFGHFEEMTPKWKRLLKFISYTTIFCLISYFFGMTWFYIMLGIIVCFVIIVHAWWLPKKGINGAGEPKEKYYKLRGWSKKSTLEKKKDQL